MKKYKLNRGMIIADIVSIVATVIFVFLFLPLTTRNPFTKYAIPIFVYTTLWGLVSFVFGRYNAKRKTTFFIEVFRVFYTALIVTFLLAIYILIEPRSPWSHYVLFIITLGVFILLYLFNFVYFARKYAIGYDVPELNNEKRENAKSRPNALLSEDAKKERKHRIVEFQNIRVYDFLNENLNLNSKDTLLLNNKKISELEGIELYRYSTVLELRRLNRLRGINKRFAILNEKLPDDGILLCCYKSKSTIKKMFYKKYDRYFARFMYFLHFITHRMFPKFFLTRRLYYDLTSGKKRILTKTEVLGRLVYCGFEPINQTKIGVNNYIIAKRVRNAEPLILKNYGALIKLKRTGKGGKMFNVYKFRTMHPYAEYIQDYVYKTSSLADGGKFNRDIRVTSLGRFMRKYWLDELPMFWNLLKGDMKLIGVRPLSKHYFSLYCKELQEKRVKFKPGLLPPFYADMPKTLDEIQASEMKYLIECERKGVFRTDVKYFFLIINNILFKKARSA